VAHQESSVKQKILESLNPLSLVKLHLGLYESTLCTTLSLFSNLKELYIAARTENLESEEEMGRFKNLLISFKKLTRLDLDIDFDLSSTIA
jgi:hypothetical protein